MEKTHRFQNGAVVTVIRLGPAGPFVEGRAVVQRPSRRMHFYRVVFTGEKADHIRFVHPDWQDDPERCLRLLAAFWQASSAPPAIEEFFPRHTNGGA